MITKNILVTGCGGDIGSSIGRILKMSSLAKNVIGCDVHDRHPGSFIFSKCTLVAPVNSPDYLKSLKSIVEKYHISLIIPASEFELRFFLKKNLLDTFSEIPVLTANKKALTIGFDKLKTADFLKSIDLPYPWTLTVKENLPLTYPCLIKDRFGAGSKNINIVNKELIEDYKKKRPNDIWQEYLLPDDEEYTCGIYRTRYGETRIIVIKRKLQGGHTVYGEIVKNANIEKVLIKLAESLDLYGSINAQLRLTKKSPVIFEINPRFSSTVVFRHLLGFQDLVWSIKEKFGYKLTKYKEVLPGIKFYRGSKEYISYDN